MNKTIQRYVFFLCGLFINSFGIAFITKSALGTSQFSSIPYVISLNFSKISFGTATFIFNMLFVLIELLILKKKFKLIQSLQIVANILFSWFIDISMYFLNWFQLDNLILRFICLLIGCAILALGISIEVAPDTIVVPGEGIVRVIAQETHKEFGKIKIYFDVTLIIIATILSFVFFHSLKGVGIGTIISALLVGKFVQLIDNHFGLIKYIKGLKKVNS